MDNDYGKRALRKMLDNIFNNSATSIVDGSNEHYSNTIEVIDKHLTIKLGTDRDIDLEEAIRPSEGDSKADQTYDTMMYNLLLGPLKAVAEDRSSAVRENRTIAGYVTSLQDGTETIANVKPKIDAEIKRAKDAG